MLKRSVSVAFLCTAAGTALTLLALPACTVTDPGGGKWTVGPRVPPQPNNGTVFGTFVGPDGNTYQLVDTNGDGVPDFAVGPDGQWRPITPPTTPTTPAGPVQPAQPGETLPGKGGGETVNRSGNNLAEMTLEPVRAPIDWSDYVDWDNSIDPPMPFDFGGLSPEDWIAAVGLDIEPGTVAQTDALRVNSADMIGMTGDATFPLSSAFVIPDVTEFELSSEIYALLDDNGGPFFMAFRVAGDLSEIVRFAWEIGDGVQELEFDNDGSEWTLIADEDAGTATLFQDGLFVGHVDID